MLLYSVKAVKVSTWIFFFCMNFCINQNYFLKKYWFLIFIKLNLLNITKFLSLVSYNFIDSFSSRALGCVHTDFTKLNSVLNIFQKKNYVVEQPFKEHLFKQNTFYWMFLTFD